MNAEKEKDLKLIREFSKISISQICRDFNSECNDYRGILEGVIYSTEILTNEKIDKLEEIILSYIENILPKLEILRKEVDEIEGFIDLEYYPFPTYDEILFKH